MGAHLRKALHPITDTVKAILEFPGFRLSARSIILAFQLSRSPRERYYNIPPGTTDTPLVCFVLSRVFILSFLIRNLSLLKLFKETFTRLSDWKIDGVTIPGI